MRLVSCAFRSLGFRKKGNAIVLCVGGAREALLAQPNHFEIVLGKRLVCLEPHPASQRALPYNMLVICAPHVLAICFVCCVVLTQSSCCILPFS